MSAGCDAKLHIMESGSSAIGGDRRLFVTGASEVPLTSAGSALATYYAVSATSNRLDATRCNVTSLHCRRVLRTGVCSRRT
jgi:hypothetical protein